MATREENLKKINAELEKFTDKQLEEVAGGTWYQTGDDSHFLHTLNPSFLERSGVAISLTPTTLYEEMVKREWKKYGVELEFHGGAIYDNKYKINGKPASRDEAYAQARKVAWG